MPLFDPASLDRQVAAFTQSPQAPETAPARKGEPKWPYLALLAGQGADALTTGVALHQFPNAQETNPMGAPGTMAAKAGITAALAWMMHKENESGHDRAAKVIGALGGLAGAVPAAWNIAQMSKAGK